MTAAVLLSSNLSVGADECAKIRPIHLDELDKTDKVRNISQFGKSIVRSISLVRKSLRRTNSNSSRASTALDCGSNHSMISLESIEESKDDEQSFADFSKMRRSCLKGTRQGMKKYVVRFQRRSKNSVHAIEPYFEYAADLWYTTLEERASVASPRFDTESEMKQAQRLLTSYVNARKQVYPAEWFEMKPSSSLSPYQKMSSASYEEIVEGRKCGLAGFEKHSAGLLERRKAHIRSVVSMICTVYYECTFNKWDGQTVNAMMQSKTNPDGMIPTKDDIIRRYARSLSECDRYWGTAIGKADYDAAAEIYQQAKHDDDMVPRLPTSSPMIIGTTANSSSPSSSTTEQPSQLISDNDEDEDDDHQHRIELYKFPTGMQETYRQFHSSTIHDIQSASLVQRTPKAA